VNYDHNNNNTHNNNNEITTLNDNTMYFDAHGGSYNSAPNHMNGNNFNNQDFQYSWKQPSMNIQIPSKRHQYQYQYQNQPAIGYSSTMHQHSLTPQYSTSRRNNVDKNFDYASSRYISNESSRNSNQDHNNNKDESSKVEFHSNSFQNKYETQRTIKNNENNNNKNEKKKIKQ